MRVYDDEAYAKEDYRGAVDFLIHHWQTGDAVLLMLDSYQVFEYYSHGKLTHYGLNPTDDLEFAASELNADRRRGHPRLWVLMWNPDWADPSGAVRAMLDETLERAAARARVVPRPAGPALLAGRPPALRRRG